MVEAHPSARNNPSPVVKKKDEEGDGSYDEGETDGEDCVLPEVRAGDVLACFLVP